MLLCNPLGAEAQQAHRVYRVLAEQLEQSGYTVLRFDYGGTGDSAGGPEVATVSAWIADIATAAQELARVAPGTRLAIVGQRLGATLAALATARSSVRARQLVLWDPIVEGLGYLRELTDAHRKFMQEELRPWRDNLVVDADGVPNEALGIAMTPQLVGELREVDLARELPNSDHVTVISTQPGAAIDRLRVAIDGRPGNRWLDVADDEQRNHDASLNAATVPTHIIKEVISSIQETNP